MSPYDLNQNQQHTGKASPQRAVAATAPSPVLARALEITSRLQTSLDPERLIEIFAQEVRKSVHLDGLRFRHDQHRLLLQVDQMATNNCNYRLTIDSEELGEITFSRRKRFAEDDLAALEHLLCSLLYPLRNALKYRELAEYVRLDALTGVRNRRSFEVELPRHIQLSERHGVPLSLIVMDLDHFKAINDTHGHTIGDVVLRDAAVRAKGCMRTSDLLFRYGGEEFIALLPSADAAGARQLAERIRHALAKEPIVRECQQIEVTLSLGTATLRAGESGEALFERADNALYQAKASGRNRVVSGG